MKFKPIEKKLISLIGLDVNFTGFPNSRDLISIRGRVSGIENRSKFLLLHSYAWMGSSGSVVYDKDGSLLGVLSAVDVGHRFGPQIIEDIVHVSPAVTWNLDQIRLAINVHIEKY